MDLWTEAYTRTSLVLLVRLEGIRRFQVKFHDWTSSIAFTCMHGAIAKACEGTCKKH